MENEGSYSTLTGSTFVFNTIVGMGVWALPRMVYLAGTIPSYIIITLSAFVSYIIATFINELQGSSNAIKKLNLSKVI